ncbi:MAG: TonB-dependent receptor [Bacteroidetes bacterium]|nr:TonB-dependent receptor [Bacteroidota bacterium]
MRRPAFFALPFQSTEAARRTMRCLRTLIALLVILTPLVSQTKADNLPKDLYGKIAGVVRDADTGESLPGVNVIIDGTTQGEATDLDGNYIILQVRAGTYTIRASYIGYADQVIENVRVEPSKTTRLNINLTSSIIQGEEVIVSAERGVVQIDRTTTSAVVDAEQLSNLPVTSLADAINLQAGVVDGRFRGGRSGEVSYLVNGVPINNAFTNQAAFEVEQNMVSSLEVISGVFNAEYGQALSGVVNIVTKDLPRQWSGNLLAYSGSYVSGKSLEMVNRLTGPGTNLSVTDFVSESTPFTELADPLNQLDIQASAGGPIIEDRLGISVSARHLRETGHLLARDLFAPGDSSAGLNSGNDPSTWRIESTGTGEIVHLNRSERTSFNTTTTFQLTPTVRLEHSLFTQVGEYIPYSHSRKYVPDGLNTQYFSSVTHIASLRYTVGNRAYGNISYSLLQDEYESYLYPDPTDSRFASDRLNNLQGANAFMVGGNDLYFSNDKTSTHTLVADYSQQFGTTHLVKAGVLLRQHSLKNRGFGIEKSARTGYQATISLDPFNDNSLDASPTEFAAYLQDKIELEGLIINAGLRYDYFNPDYQEPLDWAQGEREYIFPNGVAGDSVLNRQAAEIAQQISPRIGIAFPISAEGVMRFSAGLFFQTPALSLLYTNPEFEVNPAASSNQFGNASLKPERTLAFEVGLQQALSDDIGVEITLFSKDVRNLTGQDIFRDPTGNYVVRWINTDFGTIRGLTFSLFRKPSMALSWTMDYTLQFAKGTASDPGEAFGRAQSGLEPILTLVRLNWDRRHVFNTSVSYNPSDNLSVTLISRLRSGEPYTTVRGFVRSNLKNNADRPLQFWSDLRIRYAPKVVGGRLGIFFQVQNVFDNEVVYAVYETTGRPDDALEKELFRRTGSQVGGLNTLDEYFAHPEWYGAPRRISVGLQLSL